MLYSHDFDTCQSIYIKTIIGRTKQIKTRFMRPKKAPVKIRFSSLNVKNQIFIKESNNADFII